MLGTPENVSLSNIVQFTIKTRLAFLCCFLGVLTGCATQLVAPYDQASLKQMEQISTQINRFYLTQSYLDKPQRSFVAAQQHYLDIEVSLHTLKTRQSIRPVNSETLKQSELALTWWQEDRMKHQKKNSLSDFMIKRRMEQYQKLFISMIRGEAAKNMDN